MAFPLDSFDSFDPCNTFALIRPLSALSRTALRLPLNSLHVVSVPVNPLSEHSRGPMPTLKEDDLALALTFDKRYNRDRGVVFGRDPTICDILLDSKASNGISRQHFRIFFCSLESRTPGDLILENISSNCTKVDNIRLLQGESVILSPELNKTWTIRNAGTAGIALELELLVCDPQSKYLLANWDRYRKQANEPWGPIKVALAPAISHHTIDPDNVRIFRAASENVYSLRHEIGVGPNGRLWDAVCNNDSRRFAAKVICIRRSIRRSMDQVHIFQLARHPNIARLEDYVELEDRLWLFSEFVPMGDLSLLLRETGSPGLPENKAQRIAVHVLRALKHLNGRDVYHGAIKPANILVMNQEPGWYKLTDFSISKIVDPSEAPSTFCGTLDYCAPEMYPLGDIQEICIYFADIWSLGHVIWHVLIGTPALSFPDVGVRRQNDLDACLKAVESWELDDTVSLSLEALSFIRATTHKIAGYRPSARNCLGLPWLESVQHDKN
jgi:hypothetical protein